MAERAVVYFADFRDETRLEAHNTIRPFFDPLVMKTIDPLVTPISLSASFLFLIRSTTDLIYSKSSLLDLMRRTRGSDLPLG
jgi:hypothetical protein